MHLSSVKLMALSACASATLFVSRKIIARVLVTWCDRSSLEYFHKKQLLEMMLYSFTFRRKNYFAICPLFKDALIFCENHIYLKQNTRQVWINGGFTDKRKFQKICYSIYCN